MTSDGESAAERRLLAILEASPVAVAMAHIDGGKIAYVNERWRTLHRVGAEDVTTDRATSFYADPTDRETLLARLAREGEVRDVEVKLRARDGTEFWGLVSLFPYDLEGEPAVLVWIYDISARKAAEQEIARQVVITRNILETMDEGVIMVDNDMRVVAYNSRYAELYEFSQAFLDTRPDFHELVMRWYRERGSDHMTLARSLEGAKSPTPFQYEWSFADERIIEVRHLPREDGWFVRVFTDITERRRAQEALRAQTNAVALLHKTAAIANQAQTIEEAVRLCLEDVCAYLGWPVGHAFVRAQEEPGAIVKPGYWYLADPVRLAPFREATAGQRFEAGVGLIGLVMRTGEPRWVPEVAEDPSFVRAAGAKAVGLRAGFAVPVVVGPRVEAVLEFFSTDVHPRDDDVLQLVTSIGTQLGRVIERMTAEDEMRRAKEAAEQASRAKSSFLASMSHELRTPLSSIIGFTQLLGLKGDDALSEKQRRYVDIVSENAQHLLALINDLLDLARVEAGKIDISFDTVATDDLVEECISLIQPLASQHGIMLVDTRRDGGLPRVRADATRLKQVLLNLLSNAIKYNRKNGRVTLDYAVLDTGVLRISVVDTGPGIPPERQAALFQRFERLGAETGQIEGTGIGLVLAKQLVALMGGTLDFESVVGEGSTFWIDMPIDDRPGSAPSDTSVALEDVRWTHARPGGYTLLYVEDSSYSISLMRELVERLDGLTLITSETATVGFKLALEETPDVIILDINLPDMDGYALRRLLASDERTREIPVLALSAGAMKSDIERGRREGFREYLTKPIDLRQLAAALDRVLSELP